MHAISPKDLIPYLKTAMELESSVYSQQTAIKEAKDELEYREPKKKEPIKPQKRTVEYPKRVEVPEAGCAGFLFVAFGMFWVIAGIILISIEGGPIFWGILSLVFGGLVLLLIISSTKSDNAKKEENEQKFLAAEKQYMIDKNKNEEAYAKAMQQYEIDCKNAEKDYQHQLVLYKKAQEAIAQMEKPLSETEETLEKLYAVGWLFPKYHNFVAVCSFYEYFLTGRCAELSGPNGAYNLFESELRQNIIINSLEAILDDLESIKNNQYILYKELEKTETIAEQISSDITGIYTETIKISNASHIAASCAETSAKNTEALKYIALINAAK